MRMRIEGAMRANGLRPTEAQREAVDVLRVLPTDFARTRAIDARRNRNRLNWMFALAFVFMSVALIFRRFGQPARNASSSSGGDVAAAIEAGNRIYLAALEAGDARTYASVFTRDAVSMPARGRLVRGRASIEASIAGAFKTMSFANGSLRSSQLHVDGDTAYELGDYAFDVATNGDLQYLTGRYLVVWRREGSDWKIAVDSSQPNVPEAARA